MRAVGHVVGGRSAATDDEWADVQAAIELDPTAVGPSALLGLEAFSHVEVIFVFDRVSEDEITLDARHPRGRTDWPSVGIFAQRGKNRPNRLGVSVCRIIEVAGRRVLVEGLDAIDGTPVLDIKPVMTGFLPQGEIREPSWALEIMRRYWTSID